MENAKQAFADDKTLRIARRSNAAVLITGPTGSGKTRLAREIHEQGPRRQRAFVAINLATLNEGVLESELFGHERGAFTGADSRRTGKLELANSGTVFLDEIGELAPRLQARLLEFLQSGIVVPVGSNRETKLDVRVIAATHRDLERAVVQGTFREDLFHRLRVLTLELSPLSERREDFDRILHACLEEICLAAGRRILRVSEAAAHQLETYGWPGNIRELRNALEYAVASSEGEDLRIDDLPSWLLGAPRRVAAEDSNAAAPAAPLLGVATLPLDLSYERASRLFEKEYFSRALSRYGWRISRTARSIGISKATLLRRIQFLEIRCESFVNEERSASIMGKPVEFGRIS